MGEGGIPGKLGSDGWLRFRIKRKLKMGIFSRFDEVKVFKCSFHPRYEKNSRYSLEFSLV